MGKKKGSSGSRKDKSKSNSEQVRQGYVRLMQDMKESHEELIDPTSKKLSTCLKEANSLYKYVDSAREQALDSQVLATIAQTAVDQLEQFHTDFREKHTPIQFVQKLRQWMKGEAAEDSDPEEPDDDEDDDFGATQPLHVPRGDTQLNWQRLGLKVAGHISQTPACDFMYGLMDMPEKEPRKVARRVTREKAGPAVVAEEGIDTANQVGKETTEYIKQINSAVQREKQRPLYDTMINPTDFGQTVENFFYLSFLVKDGRVRIHSKDGGEPLLEASEEPSVEDYSEGRADKKQCVVRLDYAAWKRISEQKKLEQSFLPHRDYSRFTKDATDRRKRAELLPDDSDDEEEGADNSGEEADAEVEEPEEVEEEPTTSSQKKRRRSTTKEVRSEESEAAPQRKRRRTASRT